MHRRPFRFGCRGAMQVWLPFPHLSPQGLPKSPFCTHGAQTCKPPLPSLSSTSSLPPTTCFALPMVSIRTRLGAWAARSVTDRQWETPRRLRRRLRMRHSPQHRRHAAGRGGRSTRAASLDRQMTAIPALCTAGIERALEYVDAPGRGRASASALWRLFRQGGVAAAAARRWLLVLKPGARGNKLGGR